MKNNSGTISSSAGAQATAPRKGKRRLATINDARNVLSRKGIRIRFNEVSGNIEITGMPQQYSRENAPNILPALLIDEFKATGVTVSSQFINDALTTIADENRYNPVKDLLDGTYYDGQDRISELEQILGISNDTWSCLYLRKWLHQTVAMPLNDEDNPYGADGVLVLQGAQGEGKTYFFSKIALTPDFFAEGVCIDMDRKDSVIQCTGKWIAELGELDSTLKREQSSLKAFITSRRDTYRLPYARAAISRPRRTSFCATVNPEGFLNDESGSRRFWVVPVSSIDLDRLKALDADWITQMWRQVYEQMYLPDPQGFRLTPYERDHLQRGNRRYEKPLPGEIEILDRLYFGKEQSSWGWYKVSELIDTLELRGVSAIQAGKVLTKLARNYAGVKVKNVHNVKEYLLPVV
ncbi:MAG: virulence-associated E family protein [Lachnospiraceae bacterium]|nr:virulence-associated E family protein [Lachnospiraceae bacterium]